jgi:hypothetical protein
LRDYRARRTTATPTHRRSTKQGGHDEIAIAEDVLGANEDQTQG